MTSILNLMLLRKAAKNHAVDDLNRLILDWLDAKTLSDEQLKLRLAEFFARPQSLRRDDPVYAEILRLATTAYKPYKTLQYHQQLALSETLYQKSLNLFHLKEYKDRGTRKVQIRAILDDRTTPQCLQMNGRVFELADLSKAAPAQIQLVRDASFWENSAYFKGVPTSEVIPSLPPYHYNCRTRIVPYLYPDQYDSFDSLPPTSPIFTTVLQDRLANYDLQPSHLPAIISRASASSWLPGSLQAHFAKHKTHFKPPYTSAEKYSADAYALLADPATTSCLRVERNQLILYAMQPAPGSKTKAWFFAVFDLSSSAIVSYYKNKPKDIKSLLEGLSDHKYMLFQSIIKSVKKEIMMKPEDVQQALAELDELRSIDFYEIAVDVIKTGDFVCVGYCDSIASHRDDTLHILIQANRLDPDQLKRIKIVDDYILHHNVPYPLQKLQDWLKTHALS